MTRRITIPRQRGGLFQSLMAAAGLLFFAGQAYGQEALRMSLAGEWAAERQREAASAIGYYNLLWGPVAWRFSSGLGLSYNDNVRLQSQNPEGDLIVQPGLNTQMHWPVTVRNSLDVSLGAGYSLYTTHSDLDQLYVNPGSGLAFNVYVGDCVINLHDWISVSEYTYQNPTVGGNQSYAQLQNTAGASATWDLNRVMAHLGYDRLNAISLGASHQLPDSTSENFYLNTGVKPRPQITTGIEGGLGLITYSQGQAAPLQPDAVQWNAGVFCRVQVSQHISGQLDAGYTVYNPSASAVFTNLSTASSLYFQFSFNHQINQFINYSLSAGRSTESSLFGQPYDFYFVQLQPNWNIFRKFQLGTPFWWQKGSQLYAPGNATTSAYTQFGAGINVSRAITQKLTGSLNYQFVRESSSQGNLNYTVNIVSLNFSYQF